MRIIIIGAGKVGYFLAENLCKQNHVTIIDRNMNALRKAEENLDVLCIKGSGVSTSVLLEAGIKQANLLIAVTSTDEVNMVCCLTGKKLGAAQTIARIRDPEYAQDLSLLKEELDLDMVVNPEQAAADEIARSMNFSTAMNVESFAKGRVRLVEIKITKDMALAGMKLNDIPSRFSSQILIGVIVRGEDIIIPDGEKVIEEDDSIYVIGKSSNIYSFCKLVGKSPVKLKNVMIMGGGRIAIYLANLLMEMDIKVKILEIDKEKCIELSEMLPESLIINGDGSDEELLQSENISNMDAFIAMTGIDEENIMSALIAKQNGAKKVIAKISRLNYVNVAQNLGIDSVISPKLITSNQILTYVSRNNVETLHRIIEGKAEIIEFIVERNSKIINTKLKNLKLPKDVIIATIVRKSEIVIPHGDDTIKEGDRVIIIAKNKNITELNDIISNNRGKA
ncbi:MAG: Trk system potassium transport protein TrkA [Clostridiales bacterium GWB2_37_7]|nr:MAG: Trk system potassium transport protein TrkA [Clostridiales bacterium GWB2_37_7]